jgi:hypothetical protein
VTNAPAFSRETAELVHEALIRHWPTLVDWIDRSFFPVLAAANQVERRAVVGRPV